MKLVKVLAARAGDLVLVFSLAAIVYGVAQIYRPAAWIVGGISAIGLAGLITAAQRAKREDKQ